MCIIVDANSAHDLSKKTAAGIPVLRWLLSPKTQSGLVMGGQLSTELMSAGLMNTLRVLDQAGRLRKFSDAKILARQNELVANGLCKSNDSHIVALAMISRCTLAFTKDKPLHSDLKSNFHGAYKIAIYQNKTHAHLLTKCDCSPDVS
jgi:hypothetical protein